MLYSTRLHGSSPSNNFCSFFLVERVFRQKKVISHVMCLVLNPSRHCMLIKYPSIYIHCLGRVFLQYCEENTFDWSWPKAASWLHSDRKLGLWSMFLLHPLWETIQDIFYKSQDCYFCSYGEILILLWPRVAAPKSMKGIRNKNKSGSRRRKPGSKTNI